MKGITGVDGKDSKGRKCWIKNKQEQRKFDIYYF